MSRLRRINRHLSSIFKIEVIDDKNDSLAHFWSYPDAVYVDINGSVIKITQKQFLTISEEMKRKIK